MATQNDTPAPAKPGLVNPALSLKQALDLLGTHTSALHHLTELMCWHSGASDIEINAADVASAIEPQLATIRELVNVAYARACEAERAEVSHG